jgi:spore coat protein CotH
LSDYGYNYDEKYADAYFPATFSATVKGKTYTYEDVGVRMKGNTSRAMIASKDGTISDLCHFKVSFKATFDDDLYSLSGLSAFKHVWSDSAARKERKNRLFAEMEKLDLKYLPRNDNGSKPVTYSQELYCYHVFNEEGIAAPKAKWASLTFKDDKSSKSSSYEAVEAVDDVFIQHHFSSADQGGDLYKCSTYKSNNSYIKADLTLSGAVTSTTSNGLYSGSRIAKGKIGVEDCYNLYHPNYQLKTNDDGESSDFSKMTNLILAVNNVKTGKSPQTSLESVLDVQEFLKFEGISYTLGNFDDQRNNYNNYFVYFRPSDGKAVYLPYDWDWSLGASVMNSNQSSLAPYHTSTTHDSSNTNPLYWCTILSNSTLTYSLSSYRSTYAGMVKKVVADGFLSSSTYSTFAKSLAGATLSELSSVSSYMTSKSSVIASAL